MTLIDIAFEKLEEDPITQISHIYDELDIPHFQNFKPELEKYVQSLSDYQKNKYKHIDDPIRERIAQDWSRSFEEWNYAY